MNRKGAWAAAAALLVATAAAYAPSVDGEFHYDDHYVTEAAWVRDAGRFLSPSGWRDVPRPLTAVTFALDHAMHGFRPRGWHVTNVLVHLAAVLLAWRFARRALARAGLPAGGCRSVAPAPRVNGGRDAPEAGGVPEWAALAAAAVFALHPLQTETASFVSQRAEALSSALYLATLLALFAWDEAEGRRRWALLAGAAALHALALLAKPVAATAPAAWLLAAAALAPADERASPWYARVARRLPAAAPLLALSALAAGIGVTGARGSAHAGFELPFVSPVAYVATQLRALPAYLRLFVWPSGQNFDRDFPFSGGLLEPGPLAGAAFLAALVAGAILLARRAGPGDGAAPAAGRLAAFGALFFLGALSPTLLVPLRDPFVEHRLYLPILGLALAAAGGAAVAVRRLGAERARVAGIAGAALVLAALGTATVLRNRVWRSAVALWADAAEKSPRKARPWLNFGTALYAEGRLEEAVRAWDVGLALGRDPTLEEDVVARNMGVALFRLGRVDEARQRLAAHLDRQPRDVATLVVLATIEAEAGHLDEAERRAREALALVPRMSRPVQILGRVQEGRGDPDGASERYAMAARLDPADPLPHYSLALLAERRGRLAEACDAYLLARDAPARSSVSRLAADAHQRLCRGRPAAR